SACPAEKTRTGLCSKSTPHNWPMRRKLGARLHQTAATVLNATTGCLVAELLGLSGIAKPINAFSDPALVMGDTLRLRRRSGDAEDFHDPRRVVIDAVVPNRQTARLVQDLSEEMRKPIRGNYPVLLSSESPVSIARSCVRDDSSDHFGRASHTLHQ